jgi:hypothetical protein
MFRLGPFVLLLCACGGAAATSQSKKPVGPTVAMPGVGLATDADHDGLCDATEEQVGTDPRSPDSDGDGLPDLIELGNGFDATDPSSPATDQVAVLEARDGAALDFPVRATVDGDGQGVSGLFQSISSIYVDQTTAQDFYTGSIAISADPVDGVRSIDARSARFDSVLGRTRLVFSLHFEYGAEAKPVKCAKSYPFRYSMKSDDGDTSADRLYLLNVIPQGQSGDAIKYCLPSSCQ